MSRYWKHFAPTRTDREISVPLTIEHEFQLTPCWAMIENETRGLFGFHNFTTCPDCKLQDRGYVARSNSHGTNGAQTPTVATLRDLLPILRRKLRESWRGKDPAGPRYGWSVVPTIHDVTFRR